MSDRTEPAPELVEKVKTILCERLNRCCEATACDICVKRARAAIAVCFEDAARIADELRHPNYSSENYDWCEGTRMTAEAIRRRGGIE